MAALFFFFKKMVPFIMRSVPKKSQICHNAPIASPLLQAKEESFRDARK
jgi:hypothetical protein